MYTMGPRIDPEFSSEWAPEGGSRRRHVEARVCVGRRRLVGRRALSRVISQLHAARCRVMFDNLTFDTVIHIV
jgi:hypothetical protein